MDEQCPLSHLLRDGGQKIGGAGYQAVGACTIRAYQLGRALPRETQLWDLPCIVGGKGL